MEGMTFLLGWTLISSMCFVSDGQNFVDLFDGNFQVPGGTSNVPVSNFDDSAASLQFLSFVNSIPMNLDDAVPSRCRSPIDRGTGRGLSVRWGYDEQRGACVRFFYSGRGGNENNFRTNSMCQTSCSNRCYQTVDVGTCGAGIQRWAFNALVGRCQSFTFGGCLGNTNNFGSERECVESCGDICLLPILRGPGPSRLASWGYNFITGRCQQFFYGGSLGNRNRFLTREQCEHICRPNVFPECPLIDPTQISVGPFGTGCNVPVAPLVPCPTQGCVEGLACCETGCGSTCVQLVNPPADSCVLPIEPGNCNAQIPRFGFDQALGTCRLFTFTGCNGNANNHENFVDCLAACVPDICSEPLDHGPCYLNVIRWGFDPLIKDCRSFSYGGCRGNENNFDRPEQCRTSCLRGLPTGNPCEQPLDAGPCDGTIIRYRYNEDLGFCLPFTYTGCGGNENNFFSLAACDQACPPRVPMSACELPIETGGCTASLDRWAFNSAMDQCVQFTYRGCLGNLNNFISQVNCQLRCQAQNLCPDGNPPCVTDPCVGATCLPFPGAACTVDLCDPTRACPAVWLNNLGNPVDCNQGIDLCDQPIARGVCFLQILNWGYNRMANQCELFVFTGCQGNQNSFVSYNLCTQRCATGTIINPCSQPVAMGTCDASVPRWGYDAQTDSCSRFTYTGCNGNGNSFGAISDCVDACVQNPASICNQVIDPGPCMQQLTRYAFNTITNQCEEFVYGGCDGNSNNFENLIDCSRTCDVFIPPCAQPLDRGPCAGAQVSWGFNAGSMTCELFEYSGCPQFSNRFATFELCTQTCNAPMERCQLPILVGACGSNIQRWAYNTDTLQCEMFRYTGCGGNANNFATQMECQDACNVIPVSDIQCSLPQDAGPCTAFVTRFVFVARTQSCQQFQFGGCDGNANNFATEQACRDRCLTDVCAQPITVCPGQLTRWGYNQATRACVSFSYFNCQPSGNFFATENDCILRCQIPRCSQARETGLCSAALSRVFYNTLTQQCEAFSYGGCGGSANRFNSMQECEQYCEATQCARPQDTGPCTSLRIQYSYNAATQTCQPFNYGGCLGSSNRFETLLECRNTCQATPDPDVCSQPIDPGTCDQNLLRYGYDSQTERCLEFRYGGCGGNGNNFVLLADCTGRCSVDPCAQLLDTICPGGQTRFGYSIAQQSCVPFSFGGCVPNGNHFSSQSECQARCELPICLQAIEPGTCSSALQRFAYNTQTGQCQQFTYTGCGGTANRFMDLTTCQRYCQSDTCDRPQQDRGPCSASVTRFSFNTVTQTCQQFNYGGCLGGTNRFITQELCETSCLAGPATDVCAQSTGDRGPCNELTTRFTYNPLTLRCQEFFYGGCMGNQNNFESMEACTQRCVNDICAQTITSCPGAETRWAYNAAQETCISVSYGGCVATGNLFESQVDCRIRCIIPVCSQEISAGPCNAQFQRFAYNAQNRQCESFTYSGCGGTANRFSTLQDCRDHCEVDTCAQPADVGPCSEMIPRFRYNPNSGMCDSIQYSGCLGSVNMFATVADCLNRCNVDLCSLDFMIGPCGDLASVWHYDSGSGQCQTRTYGGCLGNPNNFPSQAACEARCTGNVCFQELDQGPCSANLPSFGYNPVTLSCVPFTYGGCLGGGNRFDTFGACQSQCQVVNPCSQSIEPGTGTAALARFGYSPTTGSCTSFTFLGVGANLNNFVSMEDCNSRCVVDVCAQPMTVCPGAEGRFAFDASRGECVAITYGGCPPTGNFFETLQACQQRCSAPVCSQSLSVGTCLGQLQRFGYDASTRQCRAFIYGGCGGTANRFNTPAECQQSCEVETCAQPQEMGPCSQGLLRFGFSSVSGSCVTSSYGGCLGNGNVFTTLNDCRARCSVDVCSLGLDPGPCLSFSTFWGYNPNTRLCEMFQYGGCYGNPNRFSSQADCQARCEAAVCSQPEDRGPCSGSVDRFRFNPDTDSCIGFTYGGCLGGGNNFPTLINCQETCEAVVDACAQPIERGPCNENVLQFAYDASSQTCVTFSYGGCGGNANRFATLNECNQRCLVDVCAQPVSTCFGVATRWRYNSATGACTSFQTSADCSESGNFFLTQAACQQRCTAPTCFQALDPGTCAGSFTRFYFSPSSGQCVAFTYTGCGGTANRFMSMSACEEQCVVERCARPFTAGPCTPFRTRFAYNPSTGSCIAVNYGGCLGNTNLFTSMAECEGRCVADVCALLRDTGGSCTATSTVWSFSASTGTCTPFSYTGCDGNPNRFTSQQACEARCIDDTCAQPLDAGLCNLLSRPISIARFRFNQGTGRCESFTYRGCFGSANTFLTETACQNRCLEDRCKLPLDSGTCSTASNRFGYNTATNQCQLFTYNGCLGNPNRFTSLAACQARCQVPDCNQPVDAGPCTSNTQVFGYNPTSGNCEAFTFGGCVGGVNRFVTLADCQTTCDMTTQDVATCPIPTPADEQLCGILFCLDNTNCAANAQLCCPRGCSNGGQRCATPMTVNVIKTGTCPALPAVDPVICTRLCEQDSECAGALKCCYTGCGTSCMTPA